MVSRRVRRRRRQVATGAAVLVVLIIILIATSGGSPKKGPTTSSTTAVVVAHNPLAPTWKGSGRPVTMAFGGDVHFEGVLATRLKTNPSTALDGTVATLVQGSQISMANFDSALTDGTCPDPQAKQYVWYAPKTAITAFQGASLSLVNEANTHGEDCGVPGLQQAIASADAAKFPVIGIGANAAQAYAPYRITLDGQRIAILSATQLFDPGLQTSWTATATHPGLAAVVDPSALVAAVQAARRTSDTVVVYLNWGTETQSCPNAQQIPLASTLVAAGADIVVGSSAHVQQGTGFLGQALVSYNLGNLAFYDSAPPETTSGTLVVTATGRHIDSFSWRPATITDGLPQPLSPAATPAAVAHWQGLRGCTNLAATAGRPTATTHTQTSVAAAVAAHPPPTNTPATSTPTTSAPGHTTPGHTTTTTHAATTTTAKKS